MLTTAVPFVGAGTVDKAAAVTALPTTPGTLGGRLSAHVVATEGVIAGAIIRALEREGLAVNASWGSVDEALRAGRPRPHLLAFVEPSRAGYPESDYIRARSALPDAAIVALCSDQREHVERLLWAGVDAILFEPGADAVIGPAARNLLSGYLVVPRTLRAALHPPALTRREREMLALVVEGMTNREIADRLYLAESTVKRHLSSAFRRLGVSSRHEAVVAFRATGQSSTPPAATLRRP
jgi:DNA-binding NarL/FixJ family response regulator